MARPAPGAINTSGTKVTAAEMDELLNVDKEAWLAEVESIKANYVSYGAKLPKELAEQLELLESKLKK